MKIIFTLTIIAMLLLTSNNSLAQTSVDLKTASGFAVLAAAGITNTGNSDLMGDIGSYPTATISGFPPGTFTGTNHLNDIFTQTAMTDLNAAYVDAAGRTGAITIGSELGGENLTKGVYTSAAGTFAITTVLTLDAQNDTNAVFIFQMASTLVTAANSSVVLTNGAKWTNVFWIVGSSATLGGSCLLEGSILANTSISAGANATVHGRLLAGAITSTGAVTLSTNIALSKNTITYTISGNAGVAGAILSWTDGTAKTTTADGSGVYSFTVSYNFTGSVTPSLTGYTFSPTNKSYTNVLANQTAQNYTATAIIYTISGNAGVAGATLSWTDGTPKTTTADGSGVYSFTVSYNFTGTVTPTKAGYTFTPISYTNVQANQTNQNYSATAITYTISGNAGIAGATLSWTDGTAKTTTADGSGVYSFTVSYNFTGTVTPTKAGYTFTPISYTNVQANQTNQNYTATGITNTISGNAGVAGVTLSWTDGTAKTTTADGSGVYSFTVSYNFTGTVTPTKAGYTFTPSSKSYTNVLANQTSQNYTATAITYTISGNAGVAGATLSWTDGTAKTTTADGSGVYSFTVSYNFTGTVTPSLTGYIFAPTSKTYTNVLANQTIQNYTATAITYTISGNTGVAGAVLSWTDGTAKTTTADGSGVYSFTVSYNFTGSVTPSLTGYTFSPTNKSYTNVLANQTSQNYTAPAITYTISGNAGVVGATLNWTDGTAKTTTTDGSGNYSFTVIYNWTGSVTPTRIGYVFTPTLKTYTNIIVNQINHNYTSSVITNTISGNTGVGGAVLSWTDVTLKTTTSDSTGNYSLNVSYNWSGTITISKTGYTFAPISRTYANVIADQANQLYTSTVITFTISGNAGSGGAILKWTDGTAKSDTADASGNYTFKVSYNWPGTVTPTKAGFNFNPINKSYTNVILNQINQNYTATAITFTISGNAGVGTSVLSWTDGNAKTTTADSSGNYSFTVSYNFSGNITASKTGYTYSPPNRAYTNLLSNQVNQNYTATEITFTISGSTGVDGVTLTWRDGTNKTTVSDSIGNYSFTVSYNWSSSLTPSKTGFSFNPVSKLFSNVLSNQVNQNYITFISYTPLNKGATQITGNSFVANWDKVDGLLGYGVDVATDSNFTNILTNYYNLDVDTSLSRPITGLIAGTKYYCRVRGYYHNLFSGYSNSIVVVTVLNTPTNLTAVYDKLGIQLKWNYNFSISNVVGFIIFRKGGQDTLNKISIDTTNGNVTTYIDKNILDGYIYNYSVSAYNLNGIISTVGATVTTSVLVPLKSPENLSGIVLPGGKIVLFWKNNSTTEDGSIIERSVVDSTNFIELVKTIGEDSTYTDSTGQSGLKYFYRIAAYRDTIISAYSNKISLVNLVTGTTNLLSGVPKKYELYQNYPNPFNPSTQIRIALPKQSHVAITIYNILGSVVERLYEGELTAGYHEIQFNAGRLSSGVYIYRMTAGTYSKVLKLVLLK
jgi:hypothetical protein